MSEQREGERERTLLARVEALEATVNALKERLDDLDWDLKTVEDLVQP